MIKAASVVLSLSIIVAFIGIGWRSSTGTIVRSESGQPTSEVPRQPGHNESGTASTQAALKAAPQSRSTVHTTDLSQLDEAATTPVPPAALPPTDLESTGDRAAEQDRRAESHVQAPANVLVLENSLVGRAFPVSASVEAHCSEYPDIPEVCDELHELLARMSKEPRDPGWATSMEEKLRRLIMVEPGRFTIRALQCRSSVCALEVASPFGMLRLRDLKPLLGNEIDLGDSARGYETTPHGIVTVTLFVLERATPDD